MQALTWASRLAIAWCTAAVAPALTVAAQPTPPGLSISGSIQPVHDPAVIHAGGRYYLFSTSHVGEEPGLIHWRVSADLRDWSLGGAVFPELPSWAREQVPGTRGLWAPDIGYAGGEYRLYYSVSTFGSNRSVIGLAVNVTLDPEDARYRWVDRGMVAASASDDDFNAIDPAVLVDSSGAHWMAFGSFWSGIKLIALNPDTGLRAADDPDMYSLARRASPGAVEAPFLVERGGYYYLFVSFDFCCRGVDSSYYTVVGRAERPTGPFRDRQGRDMLDGGGTTVLHAGQDPSGRFVGPGHVAVLPGDGGGHIVHHAYDTSAGGVPTLRIRRLRWTADGWPRPQM